MSGQIATWGGWEERLQTFDFWAWGDFGLGEYKFWVRGFGGEGRGIADFDVGMGGGRDSCTDGDRVAVELAYASTFGGLLLAFPCYVGDVVGGE